MSSERAGASLWAERSVMIVGLGGLGCPVASILAQSGVGELILVDDDLVDETNLHRQMLYSPSDVGSHKLDAAKERLVALAQGSQIRCEKTRLLPENARALVRQADLVIEGADNFATKFLTADAAHLEGKPVVHGAAVRFVGTAMAVRPEGAPCYRCLFEDVLPDDQAPNCSVAGVMGPVVGIVGALMADLALDLLSGDTSRANLLYAYDGKSDRLRTISRHARASCPLCGTRPLLRQIEAYRYFEPTCAAS